VGTSALVAGFVQLRSRRYNLAGGCITPHYELQQTFDTPGTYEIAVAPGEFTFFAMLPNSNSHDVRISLEEIKDGKAPFPLTGPALGEKIVLWKAHVAEAISKAADEGGGGSRGTNEIP